MVVPSRLSCLSCSVLAVIFRPFCSVSYPGCNISSVFLTFLSQSSCPGFPVLAVLSWLSCPGCPVPAVLSRLTCPSCPIPAVLPGCPVPAVPANLSCCPVPAALFYSSCLAQTSLSTVLLMLLSCPGSPVLSVLSRLIHPG